MDIQSLIKQTKFTSNNNKAYVNLIYTYHFFHIRHCSMLKPKNLLPQHYNILKIIKGRHPEAVTPSHILDVMLDKTRDLTRLIDKLVVLGLVDRQQKEGNKRFTNISLTPKGYEMTIEMEKEVEAKLKHALTEEESEVLSNLLDKMRTTEKI